MKATSLWIAGVASLSLAGCSDMLLEDDRAQTQPSPRASAVLPPQAPTQSGVGAQLVRNVQQQLQAEGIDPGPIDGIWGPRTEEAVREFQQARELNATGQLNLATLQALGILGSAPSAARQAPGNGAAAGGTRPPAAGTQGASIEKMFERADKNNDGMVSRAEFNATLGAQPSPPERLTGKPTFENLDANDDGFVSLAEAGADTRISRDFKQADRDNDGRLNRKEFQAALEASSAAGKKGGSAAAGRSLQPGPNDALVKQVQQALNERGFDAGAVNGVLSSATRRALENFQQAQGLQASGELNAQTLSALDIQPK